MPSGPKHFYGKADLHFITFSCYRRLPLLKTARARDVFVQELGKARDKTGFRLVGYVVMPEHVHLLISEPKRGTPSSVLHKLKLQVSRKMRKRRSIAVRHSYDCHFRKGVSNCERSGRHDFTISMCTARGKMKEKLHYMHANQVIRKLVKHPRE